jgi:hypothetical protein
MLDTNAQVAAGWARHAATQHPAILDLWPAWELVRIGPPPPKARNWIERWRLAGGKFYGGERMIALKNDDV